MKSGRTLLKFVCSCYMFFHSIMQRKTGISLEIMLIVVYVLYIMSNWSLACSVKISQWSLKALFPFAMIRQKSILQTVLISKGLWGENPPTLLHWHSWLPERDTGCTQQNTDVPGLHSLWSAHRTKLNGSNPRWIKHAQYFQRCRCEFTGQP